MQHIHEWLSEIVELLRTARNIFRRYRGLYILFPLLTLAGAAFVFFHDAAITRIVTTDWHIRFWWFYAGELSRYGAFERGTLLLVGILLVGGYLKKNWNWRRAAIACLLACLFAGLTVNLVKCTTGRPRPNAGVMRDGFYGPHSDNDYKSFPSAHAATSMATAACLASVFPSLSIPLYLFEGGVALSRVYVKGHYFSDVLVGSMIGLWFGSLMGLACRRINRRREETGISVPRTDCGP